MFHVWVFVFLHVEEVRKVQIFCLIEQIRVVFSKFLLGLCLYLIFVPADIM